jgi:hypothetical protein
MFYLQNGPIIAFIWGKKQIFFSDHKAGEINGDSDEIFDTSILYTVPHHHTSRLQG